MTYDRHANAIPRRACAARALLILLALAPAVAWADCTVSASGVSFGSYDVFSPSPNDSVGSISVDCTSPASFSVALSAGSGSYGQRRMTGAGDTLDYNLYTSASRTVVWGDGSGGTGTVGGTGDNVNLNVYGRIPAGQNLKAGSYSDAIVITVTF